jgi:DNA-binding NarL/FixJ family response regulator
VLRDASAMDVVNAVRAVSQGEAICPPSLTLALFRHFARSSSTASTTKMRLDFGLSRREQQMVPMIAQGLTNKEIACQLNIAEQTVKNHVHRMLRRVGVNDRLEALAVFRMQGAYLD